MYRYPKITLAGMLFLYAFSAIGCRENSKPPSATITPHHVVEVAYSPKPTPEEQATLHTDTLYQYEFRTGESGHYKYNYDVVGTDDSGHKIIGNVSMQGKYGAGILLDKDGTEIKVTLEWIGYGELRAEDEAGNVWELEVD